ncbi:MAG: hypothetical protein PHQ43_11590 [Dehalococcoidales bacterium]|nr:hypothetical protein [Dehalococcoidales bacterium]
MEYEHYGWKMGESIAYYDGEEYTLEHDGWWENYASEIELLDAMRAIAPLNKWHFRRIGVLRRNDEIPSR